MILIEFLRENKFILSDKGQQVISKALKEVYPNLEDWKADDKTISRFIGYDLPDEDCLKILQLAARYASLWAFA
jgi:hypothetical protein